MSACDWGRIAHRDIRPSVFKGCGPFLGSGCLFGAGGAVVKTLPWVLGVPELVGLLVVLWSLSISFKLSISAVSSTILGSCGGHLNWYHSSNSSARAIASSRSLGLWKKMWSCHSVLSKPRMKHCIKCFLSLVN